MPGRPISSDSLAAKGRKDFRIVNSSARSGSKKAKTEVSRKPCPADSKKSDDGFKTLKAKSMMKRKIRKDDVAKVTTENSTPTFDDSAKQLRSFEYLHRFVNDRKSWKFAKVYQYWLIKNALNDDKIPSAEFKMLKSYLKGVMGNARVVLLNRCTEVLDSTSEAGVDDDQVDPNTETARSRAKILKKLLENANED